MSVGGSSNLGTLLIRRLDTALSVQASQQSQIVNAARADAIAQLADASRINPVHNEGGRPLPETIEKAQAQVERQARQPAEAGRLHSPPPGVRFQRPSIDTSSTPSAPTTLGHAAKAILALLSRYPDHAPPVRGRAPLILPNAGGTGLPAAPGATASSAAASAAGPSTAGPASASPAGAPTPAAPGLAEGSEARPALIARALTLALGQSGLFYESHLQDLAFGSRVAAQLKLEPQGNLGAAGTSQPTAPAAAQEGPAAAPRGGAADHPPAEGRGAASAAQGAAASSALASLHPDTHLIVRQQLEVLATQLFGWRGEAWPDAAMEWEVGRRDEEGRPDEAGTHWATRLRLSLPSLGEVEARLSLHGKQVVMRLVAPQSAQALIQHDHALRAGFQDAGLTLSQLTILEEEQA